MWILYGRLYSPIVNMFHRGVEPISVSLPETALPIELMELWWTQSDLNRPPSACKADALPDELWAQISHFLLAFPASGFVA